MRLIMLFAFNFHDRQEQIPCTILVQEIASIMQEYTQSGGVRPFGISLLVIGYDEDKPRLYQVDPSGAYFSWYATAIGKNYISGKAFLEKVVLACWNDHQRWNDEMELEDAIHTAMLTLKESFEGEVAFRCIDHVQMNEKNIQVAYVSKESNRKVHILTPSEVKDYLEEMEWIVC